MEVKGMAAKYWIKQPVDYIYDRQIAMLPDYLWRRLMELRMLAGKVNNGGMLPPVVDVAWELRVGEERLTENLVELAQIGVVTQMPDGWKLAGFAEEQDADSTAERQSRFRRNDTRNANVTNRYNPVTENSNETGNASLPEEEGEEEEEDKEEDKKREEEEKTARASVTVVVKPVQNPAATAAAMAQFGDLPDEAYVERVYCATTGFTTIPSSIREVANQMIIPLRSRFSEEKALVAHLKTVYSRWCGTRGRNGKPYNRLSGGWLEWAIEDPSKQPEQVSGKTRSGLSTYTPEQLKAMQEALIP
jgi:hypothetical protein